jgi:hypothetical protein
MTPARNQPSKRKRRSREDWQALIRRFDSGQSSITTFCARESISEASFYRWRGLLVSRAPQLNPPPRPSEFLDLGPLRAHSPSPRLGLKLDLGGGRMLHLVRG